MCYDEGRIQSYIDGQLDAPEMKEMQEHLDTCDECGGVYRRLLDNEMLVRSSMEGLLAADRETFDAELAWRKLKLDTIKNNSKHKERRGMRQVMKFKKTITAVGVLAALAGLVIFTPVSTMASDFLTVFRAEKVKTISITPDDMQQVERMMKEGAGGVDIKNFGKLEVQGRQEIVPVTISEAREAVDFQLKVPALDGYGSPQLRKSSGTSVTFAMNVSQVNALLKTMGSPESIPAAIDGKEFTLYVPTGIIAEYSAAGGKITLAQARGPSIQTVPGVDVKQLRQALLSIPALPENLKRQLAAVEDWQSTAIIPVRSGSSTEVKVNGSSGVFISEETAGDMHVLVWQKDGVIYVLAGQKMNLNTALTIASKVK